MVHATYEQFLTLHEPQLKFSGVPKHYWKTIFEKLVKQCIDAGNTFSLMRLDYEEGEKEPHDPTWQLQIRVEDGIKCNDPQHIYLIDHAWTFEVQYARNQLMYNDNLRERMANITGRDPEEVDLTENIFNELWKYACYYSVANAESVEERLPVWYMMDEVGSAIQHKDDPNFKMVPFISLPEQCAYSLIYPLKDLNYDDVIYRDFTEGVLDCEKKLALSIPWKYVSLADKSFDFIDQSEEYFLSGHIKESSPCIENFQCVSNQPDVKRKVFSEYLFVRQYLTDERFEIVDDEDTAHILWYTKHFKNFEELSNTPWKFINQFPFEYILTIKDLLSITCRRKNKMNFDEDLKSYPKWSPTTFNLKEEIVQFVSYYQNREIRGLDNHWIIKPFNLARGLDTHITNNLNFILRLSTTGPKIAQKYIERPVLFYRDEIPGKVKFDIRYVILLKSVKPLQVYAYRNFFLRFANQPFALNGFDKYEKHFTVMNYTEKATLKHMLCSEFKENWRTQYPDISWAYVEELIFEMLKETFECAVMKEPPRGICENPQSRALYAADIMLEWNDCDGVQPKLLEVNWTPDCKRACEYYKDFYNDIFRLLFLDEINIVTIKEL